MTANSPTRRTLLGLAAAGLALPALATLMRAAGGNALAALEAFEALESLGGNESGVLRLGATPHGPVPALPAFIKLVPCPSLAAIRDLMDCAPAQGGLDLGLLPQDHERRGPAGAGLAEIARLPAPPLGLVLASMPTGYQPRGRPALIAAERSSPDLARWAERVLSRPVELIAMPLGQMAANLACGALNGALHPLPLSPPSPLSPPLPMGRAWPPLRPVATRPGIGHLALAAPERTLERLRNAADFKRAFTIS